MASFEEYNKFLTSSIRKHAMSYYFAYSRNVLNIDTGIINNTTSMDVIHQLLLYCPPLYALRVSYTFRGGVSIIWFPKLILHYIQFIKLVEYQYCNYMTLLGLLFQKSAAGLPLHTNLFSFFSFFYLLNHTHVT